MEKYEGRNLSQRGSKETPPNLNDWTNFGGLVCVTSSRNSSVVLTYDLQPQIGCNHCTLKEQTIAGTSTCVSN